MTSRKFMEFLRLDKKLSIKLNKKTILLKKSFKINKMTLLWMKVSQKLPQVYVQNLFNRKSKRIIIKIQFYKKKYLLYTKTIKDLCVLNL